MHNPQNKTLFDDGERMLPTRGDEISFVFSRHKFAYQFAQNYVSGKTVIDVGCGSGYGSMLLAKKAESVLGLDYHAAAIEYCRQNYHAAHLRFKQKDASTIDAENEFDAAVCFQAIEHFHNPGHFLNQLKKVVKPGGTILISTPNVKKSLKGSLKNPFHVNEMNYQQFNSLLQKHFSSYELLGVGYAAKNKMRDFLGKLPFYQWGKYLKRKSKIKKLANKALAMTSFQILHNQVERDAADLLAVIKNEKP